MEYLLPTVTAFHVLAGVFWAGTVFVLARTSGQGAEQLARPQIGSGAIAVLTGAYLWHLTRDRAFGDPEKVLAFGAACAALALVLLIATLPIVNKLRAATPADQPPFRQTIMIREWVAGVLLAITIICMAVDNYV
jgi:hypothetical protein